MAAVKYFSLKRTQNFLLTVETWHAGIPWQKQETLLPWGCCGPTQPHIYNPEENLPESYFTPLVVSNAYTRVKPSNPATELEASSTCVTSLSRKHYQLKSIRFATG